VKKEQKIQEKIEVPKVSAPIAKKEEQKQEKAPIQQINENDKKSRMNYMIEALGKKMTSEITKTDSTKTNEIVEGGKSKKDMSKMIELLGQHMNTEKEEETKCVIIEDEVVENKPVSTGIPIPPVPGMQNIPSVPSVPSVPSNSSVPSVPSVPKVPVVPKMPKMNAPKKYVKTEKPKEEKPESSSTTETKKAPTVDFMSEMKKVTLKKMK